MKEYFIEFIKETRKSAEATLKENIFPEKDVIADIDALNNIIIAVEEDNLDRLSGNELMLFYFLGTLFADAIDVNSEMKEGC